MAKAFRAWGVDQVQLFLPSVRDFMPDDHLAQFVRDTVRKDLDLSSILATYDEARGYPPYHPTMMSALWRTCPASGAWSASRTAC